MKWPKTPWYTKQNNIGLFGAVFVSLWKKFTVSNNFLQLVLKPKNEVSSVIEVPLFRPSFYLADNPQKVCNIHRAICLAYSCICSIRLKSEIQLFRLRIAVNAIFFGWLLSKQPRFQSNIASISLVSNQIYHRIDGISLASFQYGKRQLVITNYRGIGANQKRQHILNE